MSVFFHPYSYNVTPPPPCNGQMTQSHLSYFISRSVLMCFFFFVLLSIRPLNCSVTAAEKCCWKLNLSSVEPLTLSKTQSASESSVAWLQGQAEVVSPMIHGLKQPTDWCVAFLCDGVRSKHVLCSEIRAFSPKASAVNFDSLHFSWVLQPPILQRTCCEIAFIGTLNFPWNTKSIYSVGMHVKI